MEDLSSPRHHEDEPAREPASHASRMSDVRGRVAKRARTVPTEREHFAPGATLVRQGEVGDRAWLVVAGTLQVVVKTGSAERQIGRIGPGGIVGEMSLVDDGTRTATVRAETPVVAVPIGRGTFERAFEQSPPLVRYLLETLIATLRRSYGLKSWERTEGSPMFRSTRHSSVVLQRRTLAAGHVFFREWESPDSVYLIQSGHVSISSTRDGAIAELGPGRIFGELGILTQKPRAATATAAEPTVCEVIPSGELLRALDRTPKILRVLAYSYVRRIERLREDASGH